MYSETINTINDICPVITRQQIATRNAELNIARYSLDNVNSTTPLRET